MAAMPRHIVCLTFDFDTQSGFIARGMTTPTPLSRGEFGAVASGRILKFLKERNIKATWFTPGFTIQSWPMESAAVADAGHEIGHHSWAHIPNANQTRDEEEADLVRANESIRRLTGHTARGYRSPSWDLSEHTIDLLLEARLSLRLQPDGCRTTSHIVRGAATWRSWASRFNSAQPTDLIEMPISWSLDDHPHFEFIRTPQTVAPGLQPARAVMQSWLDEFLYMKKTVDWGVLTYTMHPYVIGRGYRMLALEWLFDQLAKEGAVFMTMEQAAEEAKARLLG